MPTPPRAASARIGPGSRESITLRTVGFTIALAGLYGSVIFGPSLWRRLRMLRSPGVQAARSLLATPTAQALRATPPGAPWRVPLAT